MLHKENYLKIEPTIAIKEAVKYLRLAANKKYLKAKEELRSMKTIGIQIDDNGKVIDLFSPEKKRKPPPKINKK